MPRRFRYLRDPVFLTAVAMHLLNRFVIRPLTGDPSDFFHCYLSDLLCVPVWLPLVLWLERRIRVREHDEPPTVRELVAMVVIWSIVFEVLVPSTPLHIWFPNAVGDPVDMLMYAAGAALAGFYWRSGSAPAPATAPPGHAYAQHALIAAAIITATAGAGVTVHLHQPWHSSYHEGGTRGGLRRIAERIEKARHRDGSLPPRLTEQLIDGECQGWVIHMKPEGEQFVLVCLGADGAPGGVDRAADVWWPEQYQPRTPLLEQVRSTDALVGAQAGTIVGIVLTGAWLGSRLLTRPPLQRISGQSWLFTLVSLGLSLAVAAVVLAVQNIPPGVH
jgi:hypothetical protein